MAKTRPRRGSAYHLTPAFSLFSKSKELVMKNIWIFAPLYGVFILFGLHSWIWSPTGPTVEHHWWDVHTVTAPAGPGPVFLDYSFVGFSIFWFLLTLVVGVIVQVMVQAAQLEVAQGRTPTFDKLWKTAKELGLRMLGLYIVTSIVIIVGFILLIVPGVFMVRRYFLSPYVMLDQKVGIREAMDKSAAISQPMSAIWGIVGVLFLLALFSVIPFIGWLISFVLSMLYSVAPAIRYQELKKQT